MPSENNKPGTGNRPGFSSRERAEVAVVLFVSLLFGAIFYIANKRYYIRPEQLIEAALYLICAVGAIWVITHYFLSYREKQEKSWPRVPP